MPFASVAVEPPPVSVPVPTSDRLTSSAGTPFPNASATFTWTAGVIVAPAPTLLGCTSNETVAAAAALTVNDPLVAGVSAPLVALNCLLPARSTDSPENVAMPFASVAVEPPPVSVPVPTSDRLTSSAGTPFPNASATFTWTAGVIVAPAPTLLGCTSNETVAAAAGLTVNDALVAGVSAPLEAESCLLPARSTDSPENVAMPLASVATAPPPVSVPVPTSDRLTSSVGTPFPNASATFTCTAGVIVAPAATFDGCTSNETVAAAAGLTVNETLVAGVSAPLVVLNCLLPVRSTDSPENVAMPFASVAVEPPPVSVPVPTSDRLTSSVGTPFPNASATFTCTAGVIVAPAATFDGCTSNETVAAAAALTVNEVLVAGVSAPLVALNCLLPVRSTDRPENVAMPFASVAVAPPPVSVPVPTSDRLTSSAGTPFPNASATFTWTAGVIVAPAPTLLGCTSNETVAAAAALTVNDPLVAGVSAPLEAESCLLPARSTDRPENIAMPLASVAVEPPPVRVPAPTSDRLTSSVGTPFPNASATFTWTAGVIVAPAPTFDGCTSNETVAAAAGLTANDALVAGVSAPLVAESCLLPARSTDSPENVAMPFASVATAPPPVSVPVPTSDRLTSSVGTPFPNASATFTWTAGVIVAPAATFDGCTSNEIVAAAAGLTVNDPLVAGVSAPLVAESCLLPARSTDRPENVAMPFASVAVAPPPVRVPVPTSDRLTSSLATPFPNASATFTWTAGVIVAPAPTLLGCTSNETVAAAAAPTVNDPLVAGVSAPLEAESCLLPVRSTDSPENVAMPFASVATAPPPVSVPVPTSDRLTSSVGTPFPNASATFTCTAGVIV